MAESVSPYGEHPASAFREGAAEGRKPVAGVDYQLPTAAELGYTDDPGAAFDLTLDPQSGDEDGVSSGPTVQIGDGMITRPDSEATLWLAIDGKGSGRTVAEWLDLVGRCNAYDHQAVQAADPPHLLDLTDSELEAELRAQLASAADALQRAQRLEILRVLAPHFAHMGVPMLGDAVRQLDEAITGPPSPKWPDRDLLGAAWGIIANAGEGSWDRESAEWREAAENWRDAYHAQIKGTKWPDRDLPDRAARRFAALRRIARYAGDAGPIDGETAALIRSALTDALEGTDR